MFTAAIRSACLPILLLALLAGCPDDDDLVDDDDTVNDDDTVDDDDASLPVDHPFIDHGEVACEAPSDGFARFTEQTAERGIVLEAYPESPVTGRTSTVAAVDGDADGDVDLFFSAPAAAPQTFENDGTGQFTYVEQAAVAPPDLVEGDTPTGVFLRVQIPVGEVRVTRPPGRLDRCPVALLG